VISRGCITSSKTLVPVVQTNQLDTDFVPLSFGDISNEKSIKFVKIKAIKLDAGV
jgi:isopentenyl phosphate kinase